MILAAAVLSLVVSGTVAYWVVQVRHEAKASRCWARVLDEAIQVKNPRAPAVHAKLTRDANTCTRYQP